MKKQYCAFVDESGNTNLDVSVKGASSHFVIAAMILPHPAVSEVRATLDAIREQYFGGREMKSSVIGNNHEWRLKALPSILSLPCQRIVLVVDKDLVRKDNGLQYQPTFRKYLARQLYMVLKEVHNDLSIVADRVGDEKFMQSCERYFDSTLTNTLFGPFQFDFCPAADDVLVQAADMVAGSVHKLVAPDTPPEIKVRLQATIGRSVQIIDWPLRWRPVRDAIAASGEYDEAICQLSVDRAASFIETYAGSDDEARMLQVRCVRLLRSYLVHFDPDTWNKYWEIRQNIDRGEQIKRRWFNGEIVAPIRDADVLLVSGNPGFKLASCEADVRLYLQQTVSTAVPMVARARHIADAVRRVTDGRLDLLSVPAFTSLQKGAS